MTSDEPQKLDPAVAAQLYLEHGEALKRFLLGVLRDPQQVHDVLQVTFIKLAESGHTARRETLKAWLFRVAYHEALAQRRRDATGVRIVRQAAWSRNAAAHSADEPLLRYEAVHNVQKAIEDLPDEQRQIVRLRIYEEKTFAQIAAELRIPLGTALGRMRAALAKLRTRLSDDQQTQ